MQNKVPGVKSVISKASNAKADLLVEPGDKVFVGDLFLEVGTRIIPNLFQLHVCLCVIVFYCRGSRHCCGLDDYQ